MYVLYQINEPAVVQLQLKKSAERERERGCVIICTGTGGTSWIQPVQQCSTHRKPSRFRNRCRLLPICCSTVKPKWILSPPPMHHQIKCRVSQIDQCFMYGWTKLIDVKFWPINAWTSFFKNKFQLPSNKIRYSNTPIFLLNFLQKFNY